MVTAHFGDGAASARRRRASFTLIEVLVAIAVFSIMILFLGGILVSVSQLATVGQQNSENSNNARAILDLMSRELQCGVNRADFTNWISVGLNPSNATTNLMFYARSLGSAVGTTAAAQYRNLSLIEYSPSVTATNASLQRTDQTVLWSATTPPVALGTNSPPAFASTPTPAVIDALDGVVAFQVTFLQQNGTYSTTYSSSTTNPSVAVGVSLALVDSNSLKVLINTGQLLTLSAALSSALNTAYQSSVTPPKAVWENAVNTGNLLSGYPVKVKTGLRFFERFIDLPEAPL